MDVKMRDKGYTIMIDALVALIFLLIIVTAIFSIEYSRTSKTEVMSFRELHYMSEDVLDVLNKKGILDEIATLWAENSTPGSEEMVNASNLAREYLEKMLPPKVGYKLIIEEGANSFVINSSNESRILWNDSTTRTYSTRVLVGYGSGLPTLAYTSRASLSDISSKTGSDYVYFGGFVGQGNITRILDLPLDANVTDAYMELNPGADFDLYINGALCGHYTGMGWNLTAKSWYLNSSCFSGGRNTININFTENESNFIGGGYISVHYRTGEWNRIPDLNTYWFPGIKGLINLYSGFYVPGDIQDMNVHLHYRHNISNVSTYLTIANVTVYRSDVTGERNIFLDWSNLSASFGGDLALANAVSKKTVPIKFGTEEFAFQGGAGIADIVFVIDSTGSMCGEIAMVHNTASDFADVLATKGIDFRLGIMEHKDWPINPCGKTTDFPYLWRGFTSNVTEFKKRVNNIGCGGGADLPESYLDALNQTRSVPWRPNAIRTNIMMGDDRPHDSDCGTSQPCAGVLDSMTDEVITWLADDNITTHVINYAGMCKMEDIANGTGGNFYDYSVASDIKDILLEIAEVIANVSLQAQMINITGNVSMDNILYPDSYIKFDTSAPPMLKHGETLLTLESLPFGNNISNGTFFVPNKTRPIDAKVTSYSGPYWTNFLKINSSNTGGWKEVYNLTDYGSNYKTLGDPYIVNIPIEKVGTGTNFVEIRTGESPSIDTGGSPDNRVIYSVAMRTFTGYSKPKKSTEGCNWTIEFFDGTTENLLVPSEYTGPKNCNYTNTSIIYDNQSSVDVVTYRLFSQLDTTPRDGRLDVKLNSKDIAIETTTVGGVRSLWGPIRVKLILWT